jgi:hypothetical protein
MRVGVPLLPITVEFRRRPLRPLRFSLKWLLLMVAASGAFFFVVGEARRVSEAMSYHAMQVVEVTRDRSPSYDPMPMSRWHSAMAEIYRGAWERLDLLLFVLLIAVAIVIVLAVLGRIIAWIRPIDERSAGTGEGGASMDR